MDATVPGRVIDPKNPMRAEMRLNQEKQMEVNAQFTTQNGQIAQSCASGVTWPTM